MGGFPALMIQQPAPIGEQIGQAMQIKSAMQQQQMQQLQIQQEQQQIQDNHALTTAMTQWDGKDYNQLPMQVLKAGGSGTAAMAMTKNVLGMKQTAGEIAKNDALTSQANADAHEKEMDEIRGRIQGVIDTPDPAAKQAAWAQEIATEQAKGTQLPQGITDQYPGDAGAKALANSMALGSTLQKEANERQKTALDAWKPAGGGLTNVLTGEKIGGIPDVAPINNGLKERWNVLHPGEELPDYFTLKPGANPADFDRVDKLLEATERGAATKAQQGVINAMRQQTFDMQRDKADLTGVIGQDPKTGRTVMVPLSQAQQMGIQNPIKAEGMDVQKAMAGRQWLQLANKQAPADAAPEEKGISQLIDDMDKDGKLGPLAGRWNDFMAGKFGSGDAEYSALRTKMGLSTTLLAQAHAGTRGAGSPFMLEHFEDLANAGKMDGPTLKAAYNSEVNYVTDRAMDPNPPDYSKGAGKAPAAASGLPKGNGQAIDKDTAMKFYEAAGHDPAKAAQMARDANWKVQ